MANRNIWAVVVTAAALTVGSGGSAAALSAPGGPTDALSAPGGPTAAQIAKALATPTTLTYWSWDLSAKASVAAFEKLHPAIKINYVDEGVAGAEYQKIRTALAANSGVPDVVFMEGEIVPSFAETHSLLDLSTMGAASLKDQFLPASWGAVALGHAVYGLPVGANVAANWYRKDLFAKAGIKSPPATWQQFAADAKLLKAKTGAAIASVTPNDANMLLDAFFQSGAEPFNWTPGSTKVTIHLNSPQMEKVANFWNALIQSGEASSVPAWGSAFYQAFNSGKLATWQAGIWGSPVLADNTKTSGEWRASTWPQWAPGAHNGAIWAGGITDQVMKASKNPIAAYEFVKFRDANVAFAKTKNVKYGWVPVLKASLDAPWFLATKEPFAGGQKVNAVFASVLHDTGAPWHYPPFMEFVNSSFTTTVGTAAANRTSLSAALDAWQNAVVQYAKQQGFTVN